MASNMTPPSDLNRRQQIAQTYRMTKESDPKIGLVLLGVFVLGFLVGFGLIWLLPGDGVLSTILAVVGGLLVGLLATSLVFGRRAQKAAYVKMDGQKGAAAAALQMLPKRGYKTDPVVGFNKQQDVVHRVVGPPGIVLVGEGNGNRLRGLMTSERRRHSRVLPETPIHEVVCGDGEGEVPLPRLVKHVTKLGRDVKPAEITEIRSRLRAIDANRSNIPMPKGPVPTSMKGQRGNLRGR